MQNYKLEKHHIQSFNKLSISERLSWAFTQSQFLSRFMDTDAKSINKNIRRNGKRYFKNSNLA